MQIWIHDSKMRKIVALNNDIPDMLSYTNSAWHPYLDQATSTFDFTIPKFSNGELHEDIKLINDECFVSFYVNDSYQVFYIATLQEDDFNIQLTCNNTNLEYALEYANPFSSESAQTIEWYLNHMDLLSFAAVEIGFNEISDRKRTLTFDSQETKMNRLQSLMSKFEAEFEFKVELNRDGTYKRIVINIYQKNGIGTDRKDVVLYYSNGLKGVQVTSDKTQMFNAGVFDGKDGVNLANVEFSEKNADGVEEFYSRKGDIFVYAPLSMQRYPATMKPDGQDNWIRKDFQTEYENVNDLKAYALRTLKQYAYPLVTYTASVQSGFVSHYTDLKLGDTIRIIDKNFVGGLALEARVSEMIISFDNPANNSFVFTNYRKLDNKPSSALQTRIEQVIESRLPYRIELATTGGVTFKNNEGETIVKPSLYKGNLPWTKDVTWHWTLNSIVTDGMQYRIQARDITDTAVLTVDAFVGGNKVATTEITLTNINDGAQGPQGDEGPQGPQGDEGPKGDKGDTGNGIANTVVTYGLSVSDTTEPATWSSSVPTLVKGMYLWTRTVYVYTNGESTTSYQISYIAKDADATAAIDKTKQELLEKLETVRDDSLAAVGETKQQLATVADDLSQAKQDLTSQAQQLQAQASAQSELTKRVSSVEETANGTKTTVSELSKTVAQNGKDITSVTARTKVVEDDLSGTKTTLSQVKTTADSASQKTATLEASLDGVKADLVATTVTADTTKTNLANYQASNDKAVANLQSNMQTANGNISSLQTKVEAVPGQITSAVSAVESKIPTSVGTTNLLLYSADPWQAPQTGYYQYFGTAKTGETYNGAVIYKTSGAWGRLGINLGVHLVERGLLKVGDVLTYSVLAKTDQKTPIQSRLFVRYNNQSGTENINGKNEIINLTNEWQKVSVTFTVTEKMLSENNRVNYLGWEQTTNSESGKFVYYTCNKIERGNVATDWSSAPEDAIKEITSLSSQIKQTADGITLLATKTELSTAKNELKSGINTATNKANNAQAKADSNAQTINTHTTQISALNTGLQAKVSQSDFNTLSGRVTTAENNITAKANELSSKITAVEGKIPTNVSTRNLILKSNDFANPHKQNGANTTVTSTDDYFVIRSTGYTANAWGGMSWNMSISEMKAGEEFSILMPVYIDSSVSLDNGLAIHIKNHRLNLHAYDYIIPTDKKNQWFNVAITFKAYRDLVLETYPFFVFITKNGLVRIKPPMLVRGKLLPSDHQPAPEDAISQISTLSSELKQTTDSIKASVSSLDKSTVKNSSLTINADGIVMKAGKSTTDVANAIGSYFAVNQNAINLFSDRINVKGSMIVSGSISSDKISSSGITANVIKGGTLQSTNGSTNFELNTGKLFYNNNNTGVFRTQDGASTMGLKFSNTSITVSGTSRILSRAILGGDRRETTLDDGKWDKGGFSGIVIETIKGVEPTENEQADALRVIADNIYFTHTYSNDSLSARGWKMETYSPNTSYPGNVVLQPYGINYRNSDIIVGDLRLDNGDGSGYWMRATINVLKNCFGHIINGGVSENALNAIRSELNKISGT